MVSRKKARGRARRAAKAKMNGDETFANESEWQLRLQLSDADSQTSESSSGSGCHHGLLPSHLQQSSEDKAFRSAISHTKEFLKAFVDLFDNTNSDFHAAHNGTKEEYSDVWNNPDKMKFVISYLITCGTSKVLEEQMKIASKYASLANYFEQYLEVDFLNTRRYPNWPKIRELFSADEHTLVSYLKRRIPCSCLDEKYEQVKSISKIGICLNPKCPLPGGVTKRSATMCCSRCRWANYCSKECQEAAWPDHKKDCDIYAFCFNNDLK